MTDYQLESGNIIVTTWYNNHDASNHYTYF